MTTFSETLSELMNRFRSIEAVLSPTAPAPASDSDADPAVNFGAIGAIIGHEMGRNFDDQGSQFDETGKQRDWCTAQTRRSFVQWVGQLVDQYDVYSSVPGMHVNGKQTLGRTSAI